MESYCSKLAHDALDHAITEPTMAARRKALRELLGVLAEVSAACDGMAGVDDWSTLREAADRLF